jgi:peptide/nickel transport system permease protein
VSASTQGAAALDSVADSTPRRPGAIKTAILTQPQAIIGLAIIGAFVIIALVAPLFLSGDPKAKVGPIFEPPSTSHALGLDGGGADMIRLLIAGTRVSLLVGFCAALVSAIIGGTVGLLSGYFGGKTDIALMRLTDYVIVIPDIPLMIVAAALFGRSLTNIIIIIGVIYWTTTARLIRAQVKSVRERVCVTLVVLGATIFGQSLEDGLNPRLRVGHLSVRRFKVKPLRGNLEAE